MTTSTTLSGQSVPRLLLLAIMGVLLGTAGLVFQLALQSDPEGRVVNSPASTSLSHGVIRDLRRMLAEPVVGNLAGRAVNLEKVSVTRVVGDYFFWVGDRTGEMAVLLLGEATGRQSELKIEVHPGDALTIVGVVRKTDSPAVLLRATRLLSAVHAKEIAAKPVYIEAIRVIEHE